MFASISTVLTQPPGNLAYHLVLAFAIAGSLLGTLLRPVTPASARQRLTYGLSGLLGIQVLLFLVGILTWLGSLDAHSILPPLERAAGWLSLVGILWLWALPQRHARADWLAAGLAGAALVFAGISIYMWMTWGTGLLFTITWLDFAWNVSASLLLLAGLIFLTSNRPDGYTIGAVSAVVLLAGYLAQIAQLTPPADYSGLIRLAQLVSFPLLLFLPFRSPPSTAETQELRLEKQKYGADAATLQAMFELAGESRADSALSLSTRVIAHAIRADSCLLLGLPGSTGEILVFSGYDLFQDRPLKPASLNAESFPSIAQAISTGTNLTWTRETAPIDEAVALKTATGYSTPTPLMLIPLKDTAFGPVGALLLLSPYSNRTWNVADQAYLAPACDWLTRLITQPSEAAPSGEAVEQARAEAQSAWSQEFSGLSTQELFPISDSDQESTQDLLALLNVQDELQQTIKQLESENQRLKQSGGGTPARADAYLEKELQKALAEVARLQNSLAEANADLLRMQQNSLSSNLAPARHAEVLASLAQDIRQPMASLAGYTDLLLQESIGDLSVMQRKFLERIKVSVTRMQVLVDDLVQVSVMESSTTSQPEPQMDLASVIEQAVTYTGSQVREKNQTLTLEVPEHLPVYNADGDALEQVLIHLLQNAAMATPKDGTISLCAQIQRQDGPSSDAIRLQVSDQGGGILEEDLPRVFSRMYRSAAIPIPGVGDPGAGLTIAKTLVETMGGRIWVESEMGKSATFHVLLPVNTQAPASEAKAEA